MNNNTTNVQMPDSLLVTQAQNSLKQLLQAFPLPSYMWRLIIKDLLHEVNDAYLAQIANDQNEYQRRLAEANQSEVKEKKSETRK